MKFEQVWHLTLAPFKEDGTSDSTCRFLIAVGSYDRAHDTCTFYEKDETTVKSVIENVAANHPYNIDNLV
jgi:hypothetical protein